MKASLRALDPVYYGLPGRQELKDLRIWDTHYHGLLRGIKDHQEMLPYIERMGVEKVVALDIGGDQNFGDPLIPSLDDEEERLILEKQKDLVLGIIHIDPGFPEESCMKMKKWIQEGPCIGIKYVLGSSGITCSHPNNDQIIRYAVELGAVIYIHTWIKVGGIPRVIGGGNYSGESTPMDVALLAKRFPDVPMICGHSGGDWELAVRAVRPYENVLFEFAGSDPHSGSVEYTIDELGVDRIVWGGHGPSRSYATELSKVLDASISQVDRMKVFGGNYRRTWAGIFQQKNISIDH